MRKRNRSRIFIDQKIQGALALRVVFHWAIFVTLVVMLTAAIQYIVNPFAPPNELMDLVWQKQ